MSVGKRIKEVRTKKDLTLRELSKKVDISISFLRDIENERSNPSLERLKDISKALDTPVSYFLEEQSRTNTRNESTPTLDDELNQIMRDLGPDVTLQFYDLKGMTDDEKENLKIFLQGLKARREQRKNE